MKIILRLLQIFYILSSFLLIIHHSFYFSSFILFFLFPLFLSFVCIVCTDGSLSLSNETKGRVEVCKDGHWGTVCDHDWDLNDGAVACRQVGFPGVVSVYHSSYFGPGDGDVLMDNVECVGNEARLLDCPFKGWGNLTDCTHEEDAGVECSSE